MLADGSSRAASPSPGNNLIAAARSAYGKIISGLQAEFSGRELGQEAWHKRYCGFRGELIGLLGLGLQKWLSKGPGVGLTYISSQVGQRVSRSLVFHFVSFHSILVYSALIHLSLP